MSDTKLYAIKVLDGTIIYNCKGNAGDVQTGTKKTCTIDGVMKAVGMVIKGSFKESYTDSSIERTVNKGELFSMHMGSLEGVVVSAIEDNSESLLIMPRDIYPGGVIQGR